MTVEIINVCRGWACPRNTTCGKSEFNTPEHLLGWVRYYMEPCVGDCCASFIPLNESPWVEHSHVA